MPWEDLGTISQNPSFFQVEQVSYSYPLVNVYSLRYIIFECYVDWCVSKIDATKTCVRQRLDCVPKYENRS